MVYLSPILVLHRSHIGMRFSIDVSPPLLSGILCPVWKLNVLIRFSHHTIGHFASNVFPIFCSHTCSLSAHGIVFFLYFFLLGLDSLFSGITRMPIILENMEFTLNDFGLFTVWDIFQFYMRLLLYIVVSDLQRDGLKRHYKIYY